MQDEKNKINLVVILGPTASGKTSVAVSLAHELDTEIISADSRQVYKGMDIGTGKDLSEFVTGNKNIPYHLIDIAEPGEKYNVYEYQKDFFRVFTEISAKGKIPVLCGGTGMYIDSVIRSYNLIKVPVNEKLRNELADKSLNELKKILSTYKKLHNRSDTDTKKRAIRAIEIADYYNSNPVIKNDYPEINPLIAGISISRERRRENITKRLYQRLNEGMIKEAEELHRNGLSYDDMVYYGLEYKYMALYLRGEINYQQMTEGLEIAIHQFSKRQMTWFRKMEREFYSINWIDYECTMQEKIYYLKSLLSGKNHN